MSKVINAAKQAWSAKEQITRNIWLAGLGAYGKGYDSAASTVTKGQSIFDELVARGKVLEVSTTDSINQQIEKIVAVKSSTADSIQDKVHKTVANVTNIDVDTFDHIIEKIEQIEQTLAEAIHSKQNEDSAEASETQSMTLTANVKAGEAVKAASAPKKRVRKKAVKPAAKTAAKTETKTTAKTTPATK